MSRSKQEDQKTKKQIQEKRKLQKNIKDKSLIIVYTGDGKGKTTAALGIIIRSVLHNFPVAIVQFMKKLGDFKYAEQKLAEQYSNLDIFTMGSGFTWDTNDRNLDIQTAHETWQKAKELISSRKYKLILLDEINYVMKFGFISVDEIVQFLKKKPPKLHIILTGRDAPPELIDLADMVSEVKNIKHHYQYKNILAQKGIEW